MSWSILSDQERTIIQRTCSTCWAVDWIVSTPKESDLIRSSKQKLLWGLLKTEKAIPVRNLKEQGISDAVVRAYCNKGFAKVIYKAKDTYSLITDSNTRGNEKNPTEEQFNAINEISKLIDKSSYEGVLLKGVTGSGKTEVYLQCAKHALEKGGSALILVPEISLTNQLTSYFASVFGDDVVFMHSKLSKGERYNNRQRIVNGESRIIIGHVLRFSCHLKIWNWLLLMRSMTLPINKERAPDIMEGT